ncbi:hypothetical protein EJ04DRAFT_338482 [Polyplosphaeria fusca]|uniref:Uncharacterized protein n=1 Tax=Polyplosphaeria fusca TaxID=682080 RepID=A0A9P4V0T5_9PLEO|nr:hypothetical protein EJ04DRAFT_338482 [Polyplosphaeria fusca]
MATLNINQKVLCMWVVQRIGRTQRPSSKGLQRIPLLHRSFSLRRTLSRVAGNLPLDQVCSTSPSPVIQSLGMSYAGSVSMPKDPDVSTGSQEFSRVAYTACALSWTVTGTGVSTRSRVMSCVHCVRRVWTEQPATLVSQGPEEQPTPAYVACAQFGELQGSEYQPSRGEISCVHYVRPFCTEPPPTLVSRDRRTNPVALFFFQAHLAADRSSRFFYQVSPFQIVAH